MPFVLIPASSRVCLSPAHTREMDEVVRGPAATALMVRRRVLVLEEALEFWLKCMRLADAQLTGLAPGRSSTVLDITHGDPRITEARDRVRAFPSNYELTEDEGEEDNEFTGEFSYDWGPSFAQTRGDIFGDDVQAAYALLRGKAQAFYDRSKERMLAVAARLAVERARIAPLEAAAAVAAVDAPKDEPGRKKKVAERGATVPIRCAMAGCTRSMRLQVQVGSEWFPVCSQGCAREMK